MERLGNILSPQISEQREQLKKIRAELSGMSAAERRAWEDRRRGDVERRTRREDCDRWLDKYGYAPNSDCPKCGGQGKFVLDRPVGDEDFGKAFICDAPGCLKESFEAHRRGEPHLEKKGIQSRQTFDTFIARRGTEEAYTAAKALASGKADFIWLLIFGGVGNGKTHLCNAIALLSSQRGLDTRLFDCSRLFSELKAKIDTNEYNAEFSIIQDHQILILDDFNPRTDWEVNVIESILQYRYRELLPTVMTTNRDLKELPERIASRFNDAEISRCVLNKGKDYRMGKRKE